MPLYLVAHPDLVRYVLVDQADKYDKKTRGYAILDRLLGRGQITSEGSLWSAQRRWTSDALRREKLTHFTPVVAGLIERLADHWAAASTQRQTVDLHHAMMQLTFRISGTLLAGTEVGDLAPRAARAIDVYLKTYNRQLFQLFDRPFWLPSMQNLELYRARRDLARTMVGLETRSVRRGQHTESSFRPLLNAYSERRRQVSTDQARAELLTLLLASHETTAKALTFALYLVAAHPEIQQRLRLEARSILGARTPSREDLDELTLTRRVVTESLRLFPPSWVITRRARENDLIGGYRIPRHSMIMLSPFITHRHPKFWKDPERFDPERFATEGRHDRHPFAYWPFSGGPRVCPGVQLALIEMQLTLAILVRRFRLRSLADSPPELEAGLTLRPRAPLMLTVTER